MNKKKTMRIDIEVGAGEECIIISDDYGNRKKLKGVMLIGASREDSTLYMMGLGDHAETARAFGEGLAEGCRHAEDFGDKWYIAFYRCLLLEMATRTGVISRGRKVSLEELEAMVDRWEEEDRRRGDPVLSLLPGRGKKTILS